MAEWIAHILGICPDHNSHINLLDFIFGSIGAGGFLIWIKIKWESIKMFFKKIFGKNEK